MSSLQDRLRVTLTFRRVQERYNLSVPKVFFSDLALPTVPQSC
jgi:hypothetical protein